MLFFVLYIYFYYYKRIQFFKLIDFNFKFMLIIIKNNIKKYPSTKITIDNELFINLYIKTTY